MNTKQVDQPFLKKFLRRVLITLIVLALALALIAAGVYVWARLSTDTSLVARGIMWGDSDAGDLYRFPTRQMPASTDPVIFELAAADTMPLFQDSDEGIKVGNVPFEPFMEAANTTAFIVLHGDQLLYEGYFNGSSRESIQTSFSAAKSFTSTLVGIALKEGYIRSLDDPITDYLPELLERDPRFAEITIRHLVTMTSGLRWQRSDSNPFSDDFISYYSPDLRTAALETEIVEAPGTRFLYNDYNPLLVGMILERVTGMSVSEYMGTRLWGPMGAEADGSWSMDSERSGFEKMFVGVNGRAIDLLKLGWLFLNGGRVAERQVVPQTWVDQLARGSGAVYTARGEHTNYYLNYWFLDVENGAYYAEGDKCQFIYVYPAADLVLARFGTDCGGAYWTGLLGEMAVAVGAELSP